MDIQTFDLNLGDVIRVHGRTFVLTKFKEEFGKSAEVVFDQPLGLVDIEKILKVTKWISGIEESQKTNDSTHDIEEDAAISEKGVIFRDENGES